ncbi:hypothetical protein GQ600_8100 [Phytophthora cactorum]|nr:hypothetical protein GQ600_8100 [Phytophthora cactorum]
MERIRTCGLEIPAVDGAILRHHRYHAGEEEAGRSARA